MLTSDQRHSLLSLSGSICAAAIPTHHIAHRTAESTCTSIGMGFLSRRSATAQKKPVVSDDLAPPPELEMDMDDLWEQAIARVRPLGLLAAPACSPLPFVAEPRDAPMCILQRPRHTVSFHARV